ncbi:hypothetical protein [Nocardia sp. NBC_01009]|uniref:hypothetical protein n=1 Tax=Nocardia sp. NBC_01009 TaxID=2975996 RepID=UPI00386AE505|nr:hypothetical protein OHA42_20230 [Nocardia sp. NBC_01009]
MDRHLKRLVSLGLRRKAKQHKIVLRAMMQIAVRHGAVETNPIDGVGVVILITVPVERHDEFLAAYDHRHWR